MTDIVDKLRSMPHTTLIRSTCIEAADEIERLRKALSTVVCGDGPKHEFITVAVPAQQGYPNAIGAGDPNLASQLSAHQHMVSAAKITCRWCGCDTVTRDYTGVCPARLMAEEVQ